MWLLGKCNDFESFQKEFYTPVSCDLLRCESKAIDKEKLPSSQVKSVEAAVFDMYGISGKRQLQEFFHGSAYIAAFLPVKKYSAFTALTGQLIKNKF